jgi:hypothetical protein
MVTSGIVKVIFDSDYPDDFACQLAKEAGMELIKFNDIAYANRSTADNS